MRRVLITGGAGFVGRHFVRHFLGVGDDVCVVDPLLPGSGARSPVGGWPGFDPFDYGGFRFVREDCRRYFRRHPGEEFDLAVHLAAVVGGRVTIEHAPLLVAQDLSIDAAFWQWATTARPRKTICFSSSAAYPVRLQQRGSFTLLCEDMIDFDRDIGLPDLSYGWAKLTCEYLSRLAFERYGLRSVCYRPFSGYGEDQDESYPFPTVCRRAIAARLDHVVHVWGSGEQMRDFIHVDDCVAGVEATYQAIDDGAAINLCTGVLTAFRDFAQLAATACGYRARIVPVRSQPEGVFARGGDTRKLSALGFEISVGFRDGVERAIEFYLKSGSMGGASGEL
jgi:nucleoside-diphosphate-sugar epimerase